MSEVNYNNIVPTRIEPINEEQKNAIPKIQEFIKKGDPNEWLVLEGKAGTGKTTLMTKAIEPFVGKKRIDICALSHKAKKVLWDKVENMYQENLMGLTSRSVASLLGMTFNLETGKFTKIYTKKKPPIRWDDIIIIDEGSMINEEALKLIMELKKPKAKVIFLGDVGQLPPIREQGDDNVGKISPVFDTKNKITLHNRVRQTSDSEILPYSDYYWENSVNKEGEEEDPIPLDKRKTNTQMIFSKDMEKVLLDNKDLLIESTKKHNTDLLKVIVYRNKTKKAINWYIRNLIYDKPKEYEIGDVLIFNDNYVKGTDVIMENSSEVSVLNIFEKTFYGKYKGYTLNITDGDKTVDVDVISEESVVEWNRHISELFTIAKKMPLGRTRNSGLKKAWDMKRRFADVDYAYTLTSHKAQGSTYKNVIVVEDDILDVAMIDNIEKSQSLYVAITRASEKIYIVSELN